MSEEASETMNLDLNLDPAPETGLGSVSNEGVNSDGFVDSCPFDRVGEPVWGRRCRRIFRIPAETENRHVESDQSMGYLGDLNTLQAGEGSVARDVRMTDVPKACENTNEFLEAEVSGTKDDVEKGISSDGSFFDCNICLDLAREPVVTYCGHLFCWSCLYRWLNVHSDAKECPVCKGEVTVKTVIPIYGQGKITHELEEDSGAKIPPWPSAYRVDSWRQIIQRSAFNLPIDEMIRILGRRSHSTRDLIQSQHGNVARETPERAHSVIDRILTSRRLRREQSTAASHGDVDLMPSSSTGTDVIPSRIHYSFALERRSQLRRSVSSALTSVSSALNEAEMLAEEYFQSTLAGRNPEQPPPADDRDSFSSIAVVTNTERQVDNTVELDSELPLSASSSRTRRRNDILRVLAADVDPPSSRRRLNWSFQP